MFKFGRNVALDISKKFFVLEERKKKGIRKKADQQQKQNKAKTKQKQNKNKTKTNFIKSSSFHGGEEGRKARKLLDFG